MGISRRNFISALSGIAASCMAGGGALSLGAVIKDSQPSTMDSIRRLGGAYLRLHPEEADGEKLLGFMQNALSAGNVMNSGDAASDWDPQQIRHLIEADFSSGLTINLKGWIVSQTECRICALFRLGLSVTDANA